MTLAARNAIDFLAKRADLTKLDAYALCSIGVSFRVHAMIPKSLFAPALRSQIAVV
jgi:acetamidase/formamidase